MQPYNCNERANKNQSVHSLLWFFAIAYAVSWAWWLPAALANLNLIGPVPSRLLHLAGGMGPLVAAVVVAWRSGGRDGIARLARACIIGPRWMITALLMPAGLFGVAALILTVTSANPLSWSKVGQSGEFQDIPLVLYWIAVLVCYGFGEEVGWRGFALPRLQARSSALNASLLLAVAWAGWHAPLFVFSPGLSNMGLAGAAGWFVSIALGSVLMTWLFNSSGGSIAAVAIFHAALDIFMTSAVAPDLPNVMGALLTIGTLLLIPTVGREHLARRPRITEAGG